MNTVLKIVVAVALVAVLAYQIYGFVQALKKRKHGAKPSSSQSEEKPSENK